MHSWIRGYAAGMTEFLTERLLAIFFVAAKLLLGYVLSTLRRTLMTMF